MYVPGARNWVYSPRLSVFVSSFRFISLLSIVISAPSTGLFLASTTLPFKRPVCA